MKISPNDISNKEFKKKFRGYKRDDVDEFLVEVAEDFENLYKDNAILRDKVDALEERLKHYKDMEDNIQKTLLMAQSTAEEAKRNAVKESEMILSNANDSGARIIDRAKNEVVKINSEYDQLKSEYTRFRAKFRNFMKSQMDMFEGLERDFEKSQANIKREENRTSHNEFENFKSEVDRVQEFPRERAVNNGINEIKLKKQENLDSIENIKTFFSE